MMEKSNRPKLKIRLTTIDKIVEISGWVLLVSLWLITSLSYSHLQAIIPIHYNASGNADGFGDKLNIFILPFITTILFVGLTILNKYPHLFNYPKEINASNALTQYTAATRLIRFLKLSIVVINQYTIIKTITSLNSKNSSLGNWFLPFTIGLIFIPIIYFIVRSYRKRNSKKS